MFELRRYSLANFTSSIEFESQSDPIAKNRIEFQWGSKLQGTSSEALVYFWYKAAWFSSKIRKTFLLEASKWEGWVLILQQCEGNGPLRISHDAPWLEDSIQVLLLLLDAQSHTVLKYPLASNQSAVWSLYGICANGLSILPNLNLAHLWQSSHKYIWVQYQSTLTRLNYWTIDRSIRLEERFS